MERLSVDSPIGLLGIIVGVALLVSLSRQGLRLPHHLTTYIQCLYHAAWFRHMEVHQAFDWTCCHSFFDLSSPACRNTVCAWLHLTSLNTIITQAPWCPDPGMYVYVCMYVCMYVCTYISVCMCVTMRALSSLNNTSGTTIFDSLQSMHHHHHHHQSPPSPILHL